MKHLELKNAKLTNYERRNNSINNNPSWYVWFTNDSDSISGKTASDAKCGYTVENFKDGKNCNVTYHITRAGNMIIDKIKEA